MKKSRSIRLVLLGGAGVALAACGEDPLPTDAKFFTDASECSAIHSEATCREAETAAKQKLETEAPRYSRKEECEAEFGPGNCETRQTAGGGSFFMPLLMGYMMGNMLGGNRFSQPVFRGPNNTAVMPSKNQLFNVGSFGAASAGRTGFQPAAAVTPVSRGGFGSTAQAYRSGAGS
jgi:uncharacterized protein YgiB involved in biofilm formation